MTDHPMTTDRTALGIPIHRNVWHACPACGGQRCQVYATEDQANAAVDQDAVGAAMEAGIYDPATGATTGRNHQ